MPFLNDLVTQLTSQDLGALNVNIFCTTRTSVPVISSGFATFQLTGTGGLDPENTHNDLNSPAYIQPGCSIVVRAPNAELCDSQARLAYNALYKIRNQFINGTWYKWVKPTGDLLDLGIDDRGQSRVSFNVIANKKP